MHQNRVWDAATADVQPESRTRVRDKLLLLRQRITAFTWSINWKRLSKRARRPVSDLRSCTGPVAGATGWAGRTGTRSAVAAGDLGCSRREKGGHAEEMDTDCQLIMFPGEALAAQTSRQQEKDRRKRRPSRRKSRSDGRTEGLVIKKGRCI